MASAEYEELKSAIASLSRKLDEHKVATLAGLERGPIDPNNLKPHVAIADYAIKTRLGLEPKERHNSVAETAASSMVLIRGLLERIENLDQADGDTELRQELVTGLRVLADSLGE